MMRANELLIAIGDDVDDRVAHDFWSAILVRAVSGIAGSGLITLCILGMRRAGRLAAEILDALVPQVVPGVTTAEIDAIVQRMTLEAGGVPATLGYRGYTKSCCTSINHVVCHGIPGDKILKDGDIVNIDVTPILDGWHGDTSRMVVNGLIGGTIAADLVSHGTGACV